MNGDIGRRIAAKAESDKQKRAAEQKTAQNSYVGLKLLDSSVFRAFFDNASAEIEAFNSTGPESCLRIESQNEISTVYRPMQGLVRVSFASRKCSLVRLAKYPVGVPEDYEISGEGTSATFKPVADPSYASRKLSISELVERVLEMAVIEY